MDYTPKTGDYVCYSDTQITIIQTGPMRFDVYRSGTMQALDSFEDSAVLMESDPEGCARYWAMRHYGLDDLEELDD